MGFFFREHDLIATDRSTEGIKQAKSTAAHPTHRVLQLSFNPNSFGCPVHEELDLVNGRRTRTRTLFPKRKTFVLFARAMLPSQI